ncbi:hypothetical protein ACEJ80_19440, partial [Acinetobacter baumannii]
TYPSYALNLAQLGALCISNLCATKPKKHTHIDLYTQNNMGMFFGVESLRNHRIKNFFRIS